MSENPLEDPHIRALRMERPDVFDAGWAACLLNEARRDAARSEGNASLDTAWRAAEAALQPNEVIRSLRRTDNGWEVWAGVPDPAPPDVDYGYGVGKGDGGWGPDWAEGATPADALLALADSLRQPDEPLVSQLGGRDA